MKKFLQQYIWKIVLWIFIALAVIHFIVNFDLVQNTKLIEQSWTNLINWYIIIITMTSGLILLIWLAFLVYNQTAKDIEKFLLKNLTTACFLLIFVLWFHWLDNRLDKNFVLTAIWAVIVFWYWYKTYERDKEIQLIQYYSDRYNLLNIEIKTMSDENSDLLIIKFSELINLWYSEFHLWKQGYISDKLWNEWEYWIKSDIFIYIYEGYSGFSKKYWWNYRIDKWIRFNIYFIRALVENSWVFKFSKEKKFWEMSWKEFQEVVLPTINECHDLIKKNILDDISHTQWYKEIDWFFQSLNSDLKD